MKYLLDTNFLIGIIRKKVDFIEKYKEISVDKQKISAITVTEIYAGCREHEISVTKEFIKRLSIIPINEYVAKEAGSLIYSFARKGITLHTPDAIIGATAKMYKLALLTQNIKDFPMLYPSQIERFPK